MFTKLDRQELLDEMAALRADIKALRDERDDLDTGLQLREQIEELKIEKGRLTEDHARSQRETEHKVGLQRKKQEQEAEYQRSQIDVERDKAKLEVREDNLEAAQERFDDHIKFQGERFTAEVGYLKDILSQILDRLPTVTVDRAVGYPAPDTEE